MINKDGAVSAGCSCLEESIWIVGRDFMRGIEEAYAALVSLSLAGSIRIIQPEG